MTITRERLRDIFGLSEPRLTVETSATEARDGYVVERVSFRSGTGEAIRGILTRPADAGPHPALVYAHSHGGLYEIGANESLEGRSYLLSPPLGPVFAAAGYVTLMLDMPGFGDRASSTESSLTKALLWQGKSLFGQMLGENAAAVTWLGSREDVDPARIGMFGISMGATLAYFLAAVDTRIAAIAHLCCYADFATLIDQGAHDRHGIT